MKNKTPFLLGLAVILLSACSSPEPLTLNEGKILNELHQTNVGKIAFMGAYIPFDEFKESDFVESMTISTSSDFNIRMFLEKTLTYSLHQLEPTLTVEELCDKGNFQLTFYIDGKEVYKNNLQTGAGSCDYKNSQTVYGIPLSNQDNPDHWGTFLWLKFMKKEGGEKRLSNGEHLLKIEVRPYIENEEFKVGPIIAQGQINLTIAEEAMDISKVVIPEIQPTDSWELSEESYDTEKIKILNAKITQDYFKDITSIVVAKNGRLLLEEYFNGANRNTLHDTRSVGKSLASTVLGIAIGEGHITDENRKLSEFYNLKSYKHFSKEKEAITLRDLLTMSSPFNGSDIDPDSPGNEENMYPTSDWVKFTLDLPIDESKLSNKHWDYFTAGVVVLGEVLEKSVPDGLQKYADKKLFQPLGISNYQWQFTPTKVPNTAGSFQLNTLDYARYGQLYLDEGKYKGQEIIPRNWVAASLSHQIQIPEREEEYYGYLFWNKTYEVNGKKQEVYYASGNGGNKIMILKDLGIVIVITAMAYGQPYMHLQADEIVEKYILPSVVKAD